MKKTTLLGPLALSLAFAGTAFATDDRSGDSAQHSQQYDDKSPNMQSDDEAALPPSEDEDVNVGEENRGSDEDSTHNGTTLPGNSGGGMGDQGTGDTGDTGGMGGGNQGGTTP